MTKFKFKLESLLNVRKKLEDNLKNELGKAIQVLEHEKDLLCVLEKEMDECRRDLGMAFNGKITVEEIKKYNLYIDVISTKIKAQKDRVNKARNYVDKIREELLKVVKDRQILEKYKEKKYSDYIGELAKEEQKTNDEITSYKFAKANV